jgi:nicotinamidase-related amidase
MIWYDLLNAGNLRGMKTVATDIIEKEKTGIVIVDTQVKLMAVMRRRQTVVDNIVRLLDLAKLYDFPVILTEQYPKMIGPTVSEIKEALSSYEPIGKMEFNCCAVKHFTERLKSTGSKKIILCGVETHICVMQTCHSLLEQGYTVHVPQDAVDSRTEENWQVGLELMKREGAVITSTETVTFQFLKRAGTREFKEMLKKIK